MDQTFPGSWCHHNLDGHLHGLLGMWQDLSRLSMWLEEVIKRTWSQVDLRAELGQSKTPHSSHDFGMMFAQLESFSRMQPWENKVVLRPSGTSSRFQPAKLQQLANQPRRLNKWVLKEEYELTRQRGEREYSRKRSHKQRQGRARWMCSGVCFV